jgi:uncharacterized damage-inducible protein DinB
MITPAYVRTMAAYNAEMNRRLYAAATRVPDAERKACFDGWPRPPVRIKESAGMIDDFDTLATERVKADMGIEEWAGRVTEPWLAGELVWLSGAAGREMKNQRGFLVAHLFNHQTHHRGQAHAMITACGQPTGDTDLMLILDGPR